MLLRNFWRLSLCLVLLNIKNILCLRKNSLAFVIDDTYSMQNEIDQVTAAVDSIIDIMKGTNTSEIEDMVLVTFNDPDYKLLLKSDSRPNIKSVLGSIVADGGGDCPEMALSGTKLGLDKSLVGSYLYVFTDEYPKDMNLENDVIKICQEKQIQVVFVVSPTSVIFCKRQKNRNFTPYYNIAKACSGQVFRLSNKHEVKKVLPYVKEIAKGPRTVTLEKTIPANETSTVEFTIDDETEYAVLSAAGQKVTVHLKSGPTPDTPYEEIVGIDNLKIIKITKPGNYVFEVKGKSPTSIVVFGRTDFTFRHGFSDNIQSSFNDSVTQSNEETETNLLISVDDPNKAVEIQSAQILDMSENVLQDIPLKLISGNYYATNRFVPPSTTYKIAVLGKAIASGEILLRTTKTPIKPNPKLQAPTITIGDGSATIAVPYNTALSLSCVVTAYPKPDITWSNENHDVLTQKLESANLTKYISSITVPNIKTRQNYYCSAVNDMGSSTTRVKVKVMDPFVVHEKPDAKVNAVYGKQATLLCNITSHLPMTIQWFFEEPGKDETIIHSSDKYAMSSGNTLLQIKHTNSSSKGKYTCAASLVGEENKKISFTTQLTIFDLVVPKIDKGNASKTVRENAPITLHCNVIQGNSIATITWEYKNRVIASGALLNLTNVSWEDAGNYKCIAKTDLGTDEHVIKLDVEAVPAVNNSVTNKRVDVKDNVNLQCTIIKGNPKPTITWMFKNKTVGTGALLELTDVSVANAGDYKCIVENNLGRDEDTIKLDVDGSGDDNNSPAIKAYVAKDTNRRLHCSAASSETDNVRWFKDGFFVKNGPYLDIANAAVLDSGHYTCRVDNSNETNNGRTLEVIVGTPPALEDDAYDQNTVKLKGQNDTVTCKVKSYKGTEKITWLHNGKEMPNQHNIVLHVSTAGDYTCKVSNNFGEVKQHFNIKPAGSDTSGCLIDVAATDGGNLPLILTNTSELPSFIIKERHMIIPSGTPLKLSCNKFQKFPNSKEINVVCSKGDQFLRVEDNDNLKLSDLYCSEEIEPKIKKTRIHCFGKKTETVKIGFQLKNFIDVYQTCYDTDKNLPRYTKVYVPNPKYKMYENQDFDEQNNVYGNFSTKIVEPGNKKEHTNCYYVKGQLVNPEDIIYGVAQTSAWLKHELNDIYYYSCVHQPSWKDLSDNIRRQLAKSRENPGHTIWSGTSHWQEKSEISVPRYLWKVVKAAGTGEALAFVDINGPFPTPSDVLCGSKEKCKAIVPELSDGHIYCCEVSDFVKAFHIPNKVFEKVYEKRCS